jgi:hypothetical protein
VIFFLGKERIEVISFDGKSVQIIKFNSFIVQQQAIEVFMVDYE